MSLIPVNGYGAIVAQVPEGRGPLLVGAFIGCDRVTRLSLGRPSQLAPGKIFITVHNT